MKDLLRLREEGPPSYTFLVEEKPEIDTSERLVIPREETPKQRKVSEDSPLIFPPDGFREKLLEKSSRGVNYFEIAVDGDTLEDILGQPADDVIDAIESEQHDDLLRELEYAERRYQNREDVVDAIRSRRVIVHQEAEFERKKAELDTP